MLNIAKYSFESYPNGMNKSEFIKEYKKFVHETGLAVKDCIVGAGGTCLLLGLRKVTSDIDMSVPEKFFNKCKLSGKYEIKTFQIKPGIAPIEVIPYNAVIDLHLPDNKETVMIDGVCSWSPEEVYKFKTTMNRPKDQNDIHLLKEKYGFK